MTLRSHAYLSNISKGDDLHWSRYRHATAAPKHKHVCTHAHTHKHIKYTRKRTSTRTHADFVDQE